MQGESLCMLCGKEAKLRAPYGCWCSLNCKAHWRKNKLPTTEQIEQRCAEIRKHWSRTEERKRRVGRTDEDVFTDNGVKQCEIKMVEDPRSKWQHG